MKHSALVLWVTVLVFSLAALVWAWLYPLEKITVTAQDSLDTVPGTEGAGFSAFAVFVITTSVLALVASVWVFITQKKSVWMMVWTTVVVALSTWWFLVLGTKLVDIFHPEPPDNPAPGTTLEFVNYVHPSVGLLAAPTVALLVYWMATVFND